MLRQEYLFLTLLIIFSYQTSTNELHIQNNLKNWADAVYYQPEQVHLSFGDDSNSIIVTWSTRNNTGVSIVEYGINDFAFRSNGSVDKFVDGGDKHKTQYIHRVKLLNLKPNTTYIYHCGSKLGWSPKFQFRNPPAGNNWSPTVALFGDMGNENAQSLARLQKDTQKGMYDAIIHVGDFAYDMNTDDARVGDEFMRQIETIAAYVPYMVCPGNHEEKFNFSNYRARFSMPGGTNNLFYSFDLGPIHFIGFSTEMYYFLNYGLKTLVFQYEWLKNDLIEANKAHNREKRPWIVTYGHRPMYCSNENDNDCTHSETLTRVGWPFLHLFGLEDLFFKYAVDVEIWAHEHSYERLWPIYNYKVLNGSFEEPYRNPKAPIHLVTGSAGCKEGREPFLNNIPEWSAFHSQDYGYTRMKAYNKTHIYFEQVSDDKNGDIIDSFWVIKDTHSSYQKTNQDIVVTWSTRNNTKESICEYGIKKLENVQISNSDPEKFIDSGKVKKIQYIHRVTLTNLLPETLYKYHCGSMFGWSAQYSFRTPPKHNLWSPTIAIFGDMGNENAQSLGRLQLDTQMGMYDAILHVGDFAYDLHTKNGDVGDEFMRQIESIAAFVPYMTCAGNHESTYNFSHYRKRFSMPGGTENLFYSFDLGPIHFIGFSTEVYYYLNYGYLPLIKQYDWLVRDLIKANRRESRVDRPWIVTYGHRPMYCSNDNGDDCSHVNNIVRKGLPIIDAFGLEKLFFENGVDLEIWAHEHCYERLWPIYDYNILNGSKEEPYHNPGAPVHLITGAAGNKEGREPFFKNISQWSAFHSQDFGYTRLKAYNKTHLYLEQISDDKNGSIIDSFWIVKDSQRSYEKVNDIVVTWSTLNATNQSIVIFGENFFDPKTVRNITGTSALFIDGGSRKHSQYIHKVILNNLSPKTRYDYNCGSDLGWSATFYFITPDTESAFQPSLAIFGDMGNENAQSLSRLQLDTQSGMYDALIHVGDFAYDMDSNNAEVGDAFMSQIQAIAGYVPYMACPGNHEEKYNFSNYINRFNMPQDYDSLWYSFDLGPVHFVSFSTEVYYFLNYGYKLLTKQFAWLEKDLEEANKPEKRAQRPWIITYGHRPMYCNNQDEKDCNERFETFIRKGLPILKTFGLEDLFYRYGVDVEIFAHEHFYTRLWPIYDFKVYNGSIEEPYRNAKAPIQIITGSAGCKEEKEPFPKNLPPWNAFHSNDYGYTRMKAFNHTHLHFEQVSDDRNGSIIDTFWIIKEKHGPYTDF